MNSLEYHSIFVFSTVRSEDDINTMERFCGDKVCAEYYRIVAQTWKHEAENNFKRLIDSIMDLSAGKQEVDAFIAGIKEDLNTLDCVYKKISWGSVADTMLSVKELLELHCKLFKGMYIAKER